jgi:hypothetical protein
MNYSNLPSEISLGGIYFPSLLFAGLLSVFMAWVITQILNRPKAVRAEIENREFLKRGLFFPLKFSKVSIIRLMTRYITMVSLITIALFLPLVISE